MLSDQPCRFGSVFSHQRNARPAVCFNNRFKARSILIMQGFNTGMVRLGRQLSGIEELLQQPLIFRHHRDQFIGEILIHALPLA